MPLKLDLTIKPATLFSRRLVRIKFIQHIQDDLRKTVRKVELKTLYLNQAYILHLIAFWQVFVEELAEYAFGLIEKEDGAGVFRDVARAKLVDSLKRFNTPNQENIDRLFRETLNISKISQCWAWQGVSRDQAISTLNSILKARHEIAHKGLTSLELNYDQNYEYMETLVRLAELTEETLLQRLAVIRRSTLA